MKKDIDKEVEICDCCEVHENLLQIVNETIPEENELYDLAELFKVFGDSTDRKSTRLNSSHTDSSRMPSSA